MSKTVPALLCAAPTLAAQPAPASASAQTRAGSGSNVPKGRDAGSQFAALLDARSPKTLPATLPATVRSATAFEAAATNSALPLWAEAWNSGANPLQKTLHLPTQPPMAAPEERGQPSGCIDSAPRVGEPAAVAAAPAVAGLAQRQEGPRAPPRVTRVTSTADDVERLIDELAEFVLRQPGARAQSWSVTLWLRASVLRDTCLTMRGEPGRVAISFATDNATSLRWLLAGQEDLQARLRERIHVPTLDVTIDAAQPRPEASPA
jgi:hypothetical protein